MKGSAKRVMTFGFTARLPEQNRRATWRYEFSDRYKEKTEQQRENDKNNGGNAGTGMNK